MLPHYKSTDCIRTKFTDCLEVSTGLNGITLLKGIELKSRFSGSRKLIVDARGMLRNKPQKPPKQKKDSQPKQKTQYKVNKSRVSHILLNYINSQKGKKTLYFYTISFPAGMPDNTAHKCLNSWLTSLRYAYKLKNYLWITERQKNGTIAIREFLPIILVNNLMKKLIHYYIRKGEIKWNHYSCSRYNGVDIAKDRISRKVTNFAANTNGKIIASYLTKYISKGKELFSRQAWQCSKSLSAIFTKYNMTFAEFERDFLHYIDVDKPIIESDFFTFYGWIKAPPPEIVFLLHTVNSKAV